MRILYITHSNIWGGANVALFNIIKAMQERGHKCYVLTDSNPGPFIEKLNEIGCHYYQYKLYLTIYPQINQNLKWLRFIKRLPIHVLGFYRQRKYAGKLIEKLKPDLVHTNVGPFSIAIRTCIEIGIPHVWHIREYQDKDFKMHFFPTQNRFQADIHREGNWNIAITKGVFEHHHLRDGIDRVIYDGVFSNKILGSIQASPKENFFLFVGRIDEAKSPYDAIRVFCDFHKLYPHYKFLLAGSYKEDSQYKLKCDHFINENGLSKHVFFLGERKNVYQLMSKACALRVPSKFEGFGFITAEAMLNNCIVIGRNTGGTKEQFDVGLKETGAEIGLRFMSDDELLDSLIYVVKNDTSKMRAIAKDVVLKHYSIEKHIESLLSLYNTIISWK